MLFHRPVVAADDHGKQVGAERPAFREPVEAASVGLRIDGGKGTVGYDDIIRGRHDRELIRSLDVGLVETGKEAVGSVRFEIGVEVLFPVRGIDELMEAIAGMVKLVLVLDPNDVGWLQC